MLLYALDSSKTRLKYIDRRHLKYLQGASRGVYMSRASRQSHHYATCCEAVYNNFCDCTFLQRCFVSQLIVRKWQLLDKARVWWICKLFARSALGFATVLQSRASRGEFASRIRVRVYMHGSRVTYSAILCHDFCTMYEPIARVIRYARGEIIRSVSPLNR